MVSPLLSRIEKLEAKVVPPETALRCWRVVCNQGDEEETEALAQSNGYDRDDDGHMLFVRSVVTPRGQQPEPRKPYMA